MAPKSQKPDGKGDNASGSGVGSSGKSSKDKGIDNKTASEGGAGSSKLSASGSESSASGAVGAGPVTTGGTDPQSSSSGGKAKVASLLMSLSKAQERAEAEARAKEERDALQDFPRDLEALRLGGGDTGRRNVSKDRGASNDRGASKDRNASKDRDASKGSDSGKGRSNGKNPEQSISKLPVLDRLGVLGPYFNLLPREMKDEIYQYLLHHRKVEYTPEYQNSDSKPHSEHYRTHFGRTNTYWFYPKLMAVNKATRDDVAQYLIHENTFVLVTFDMPDFHRMLHLCNVPIVTDRHLGSFNLHSVDLDLYWTTPSPVLVAEYKEQPGTIGHQSGRVLMFATDFPKLCNMLKFQCAYAFPRCVYVMTGRTAKLRIVGMPKKEPLKIKLEFLQPLKPSRQTSILNALQTITGGGYDLTLKGVSNIEYANASELIEEARRRMAPRIIWLRALAWEQLQITHQIKKYADGLVAKGDIEGALHRLMLIMDHAGDLMSMVRMRYFETHDDDFDAELYVAIRQWYLLRFDLAMSCAECLYLTPGAGNDSLEVGLEWLNRRGDLLQSGTKALLRMHMKFTIQTQQDSNNHPHFLANKVSNAIRSHLADWHEYRTNDRDAISDRYVQHDEVIFNQVLANLATVRKAAIDSREKY